MLHIIEHTLLDSIKLVPFLFLTYLAMEYLEHKAGAKTERLVRRAGTWGPLIGGALGAVPQCGFSAAASNLYAGRIISLGTLLAIYLSTSDEMLPILLSSDKVTAAEVTKIVIIKALIGIFVGFVVDMVMQCVVKGTHKGHHPHEHSHVADSRDGHSHGEERNESLGHSHVADSRDGHSHGEERHESLGHSHVADSKDGHSHREERHESLGHSHVADSRDGHSHGGERHESLGHSHVAESRDSHDHDEHYHIHEICVHEHCDCEKDGVWLSAIKHTLQITFFIILITFILNLVLHFVGEDILANLILNRPVLGPVVAGVVGLIPNCASSVVITQLYLEGVIGMGTMMAGLLVGAGVGLLVLFRVNQNKKESIKIAGLLYLIGVLVGIMIEWFM
ncbi:MAG: arsenic efflux protein [Lachnospiraceae bacterium]|nr:arsenic efflux protein [Lachnospiraceae bacterium]